MRASIQRRMFGEFNTADYDCAACFTGILDNHVGAPNLIIRDLHANIPGTEELSASSTSSAKQILDVMGRGVSPRPNLSDSFNRYFGCGQELEYGVWLNGLVICRHCRVAREYGRYSDGTDISFAGCTCG